MTFAEAVFDLLADGKGRTVDEIVNAVSARLGRSKSTLKAQFSIRVMDNPRLDRRQRVRADGKKGTAPFEYFLAAAGSDRTVSAVDDTAAVRKAILDALTRGEYRSQDDLVYEISRSARLAPDVIRIRLTIMAASGELERSYLYRIPRKVRGAP